MNTTNQSHLKATASARLSPGKGILAADESLPTIGKRFAAPDISSTEDIRGVSSCAGPALNAVTVYEAGNDECGRGHV
jgi:hypothetical protein